MGYAGNYEPNYIVPTFISTAAPQVGAKKSEVADLDFFIGDDAMEKRANYNLDYPIRHGLIDNWDNMERYWQRCMYQYLRCDPEEHYVLLVCPYLDVGFFCLIAFVLIFLLFSQTEPPMNSPENREYTAEIMFETFNVPGLSSLAHLGFTAYRIS
jgi:actin-related protein 3